MMKGVTRVVELANQLSELERLMSLLAETAAESKAPDDVVCAMRLALEEIVVNVIHHGYDDQARHVIRVRFELGKKEWTTVVEDDARPYNPLDRADPDVEAAIEDRPIGGLGVFLVRELMDAVEYRREGGKNILTVKKQWA